MPVLIPDEFLDRMAEKFRTLGDPTRLAILRTLLGGEKSVGTVVAETGQHQANVSKHLKMLADAGMVSRRKEGLQVFYAVGDPVVENLCELVCGAIVQEARADVDRNRQILKTWDPLGQAGAGQHGPAGHRA